MVQNIGDLCRSLKNCGADIRVRAKDGGEEIEKECRELKE